MLGEPGGFPIAPWTPSACPLPAILSKHKGNDVPIINRLIFFHPKGARRFPKGDRKALWSPVRAKPYLGQKTVPNLIRYLFHCLPQQPGGFPIAPWTPSESPPLLLVQTINKGKSPIQTIPQALGLGVMGQGPIRLLASEGFQRKRTAQWAVAEGEFPERSGGGPIGKPFGRP